MPKNKVVLDTNALLTPGKYGRDIFEDLMKFLGSYEALIPSFVVEELNEKAEKGKGKVKEAAKLGMQLLSKTKVVNTKKDAKTTDTAILNFAQRESAYIYTADKELWQRAKSKGIKVIYVGQQKYSKGIRSKRR